jgi:cyclic pyranopterin phosphate synthase
MPREVFGSDYQYLPRSEILTFEEIDRMVAALVPLGIEKIRLTGGEPLLRREFPKLVRMLSRHDVELALTTNGVLLGSMAEQLVEAGLDRVTVSLDALDEQTFQSMSDTETSVDEVLAGIDAAVAAGLAPVKVNAVIQRGVNEHAILELFEHFQGTDVTVRFIEYMDVGGSNQWRRDEVVTGAEILEELKAVYDLQPIAPDVAGEVAKLWQTEEGDKVGLITSVSEPFCGDCCRARLSSSGELYTCLFSESGFDLKGPLRGGASDHELQELVRSVWLERRDRYSEERGEEDSVVRIILPVEMSHIGG